MKTQHVVYKGILITKIHPSGYFWAYLPRGKKTTDDLKILKAAIDAQTTNVFVLRKNKDGYEVLVSKCLADFPSIEAMMESARNDLSCLHNSKSKFVLSFSEKKPNPTSKLYTIYRNSPLDPVLTFEGTAYACKAYRTSSRQVISKLEPAKFKQKVIAMAEKGTPFGTSREPTT